VTAGVRSDRCVLDDGYMDDSEERSEARVLADVAMSQVGRALGRQPVRALLRRLSRGRLGRNRSWPVVPVLGTPWQDTVSPLRSGWRERAAYLQGKQVFAVDYQTCRQCGLGWVEEPHTVEEYQRSGLASAGLAALRADNPGLEWHTLGGHFRDSEPFWTAVGAEIPGGYRQRVLCSHRSI
jgi:hypothetical protein